jgi:RNA polymerase sigma factor (sigma-70 family)
MANTDLGTVLRHIRRLVVPETLQDLTDRELLRRFVAGHEEAAFTAIVQRYAPLVWRVCRHVLRHEQDAEDALQASFVILARHAPSIRKAEALASWLHGVAFRTAMMAKRSAAIRRVHESEVMRMRRETVASAVDARELQAIVDEEVRNLPEKYRAPFVLCCLEGRSQAEAARELGWKEGTVSSRLAEARKRLRQRLARRGVSLSAVLCLAVLARGAAKAAVPTGLVTATIKVALLSSASHGTKAGAVSATVAALVKGVTKSMLASKCKVVTLFVLAFGVVTAGIATVTHHALAQGQSGPAAQAEAPKPAKPKEEAQPDAQANRELVISGRVRAADEKPVADARVLVVVLRQGGLHGRHGYPNILARTRTDAHGDFRLGLRYPAQDYYEMRILAGSPDHGMVSQPVADPYAWRQEVLLKFPNLQPRKTVTGKLVDVQGVPARGVRVRMIPPLGYFDGAARWPCWPKAVTTDEQGRFTMRGLSRNFPADLEIDDDRYARQVVTVPADTDKVSLTLEPATVLEGRVLYEDTGKPVANAVLGSTRYRSDAQELAPTTVGEKDGQYTILRRVTVGSTGVRTDAQGRFRLVNCPDAMAFPPPGEPYLARRVTPTWPKAAVKQEVEIKLERGVVVCGKVTEAGSGKPVAGAYLGYLQRSVSNPLLRPEYSDTVDFAVTDSSLFRYRSGADGSFEFVIPPGRGHLLVRAATLDYLHVPTNLAKLGSTVGNPVQRMYPDGLVKLDSKPGDEPLDVRVELRRGVTVKGRVLGPDGKPVAKSKMACLWYLPVEYHHTFPQVMEIRDGTFELPGCDPEKAWPAFFLDAGNQFGAQVMIGGKGAGDRLLTVRLVPLGGVKVRFVNRKGQPVAGYHAYLNLLLSPSSQSVRGRPQPLEYPTGEEIEKWLPKRPDHRHPYLSLGQFHPFVTDDRGEVTFRGLIDGATYQIELSWTPVTTFTAESGKTLELPAIVVK